jgi:hypothetical protein
MDKIKQINQFLNLKYEHLNLCLINVHTSAIDFSKLNRKNKFLFNKMKKIFGQKYVKNNPVYEYDLEAGNKKKKLKHRHSFVFLKYFYFKITYR